MGPTSGWSETEEYRLLSQFQLPFARHIIAYVLRTCDNLRKCDNLVGVMVFGHKAAHNILPWMRMNFSQKFLIQNVFLSHPQNIQWRYTYDHAQNYVETFCAIMNLLGVDIPPLDGLVQLRFLMTKKRTMEMMECVEEFVDSEVLEAVQQRTDKVKFARMAKVEEIMEALKLEDVTKTAKRMAVAVAAVAQMKEMKEAAVTAAVDRRRVFVDFAGSRPSFVLLCNHVGCTRLVISNGVCRGHGPRCSHVGCTNAAHNKGVCRGHGPRCSHVGCSKDVYTINVCKGHGPSCSHVGCGNLPRA